MKHYLRLEVLRLICISFAALLFAAVAISAGRHSDPELEALLPQTLGGVALTIESQAGPELATNSAAFDAFLKTLGKSRDDFTLASAYARRRAQGSGGGLAGEGRRPCAAAARLQGCAASFKYDAAD